MRQEIAMWVLGLLWTGLSFLGLVDTHDVSGVVQLAAAMFVLLVPVFLIVFSLRTRKKDERGEI